jgi:hypothetical protein
MQRTEVTTIRQSPAERQALEQAAASDERTVSATARRAIAAWLRERGHLPAEPKEGWA